MAKLPFAFKKENYAILFWNFFVQFGEEFR